MLRILNILYNFYYKNLFSFSSYTCSSDIESDFTGRMITEEKVKIFSPLKSFWSSFPIFSHCKKENDDSYGYDDDAICGKRTKHNAVMKNWIEWMESSLNWFR